MASGGHAQPINALGRFLGKLELLVGLVSLGLATLLLRVETRRLGRSEGADQVLALLSILTAGMFTLTFAKRSPETIYSSPS